MSAPQQKYHNAHGPKGSVGDRSKILIALAARPEGVTNSEAQEAMGEVAGWVSGKLSKLITNGHLVRCKRKGQKMRHFVDRESANAWMRRMDAAEAPKQTAKLTSIGEKVREVRKIGRGPGILLEGSTPYVKRAQAAPAGVLLKKGKAPAGEVTLHAEFKHSVTLMPEYDARFQIDPATKVVGGFATMGIGRYIA